MAFFSFGLGFYGVSVYVATLQRLHGWSSSIVSAPVTVYYLAGALLTASIGDLYARCGPRAVVTGGAIAMAAGVTALGVIAQPWQLYPTFLVMSLGWGAMSGAAINIILAPWFQRRRGLAVSIAFNGATLGGVIIAPALIPLIGLVGFPSALAIAALILIVVLLAIAARLMRRDPEELGLGPDGDLPLSQRTEPSPSGEGQGRADAVRTWRFWSVSVPFALGLAAQVGVLTHLIALLTPTLGAGGAARAVSATTAAALVGRLVTGLVVDRLNRRLVSSATLVVQMVGLAGVGKVASARLCRLRPVRPGCREPDDPPRPCPRRGVAARTLQRAHRSGCGDQSVHLCLRTLARRCLARLEWHLWLGAWCLHGASRHSCHHHHPAWTKAHAVKLFVKLLARSEAAWCWHNGPQPRFPSPSG